MGLSESTLSFNRKHTEREQSIPVGFCPMRGRELVGEVHDENASVLLNNCVPCFVVVLLFVVCESVRSSFRAALRKISHT